MPKVLYISLDGMTDPIPQSQVIPYMEGVSKHGYKVQILSAEKPEAFEKEKSHVEELCKKAEIIWHPIPYSNKPPVLAPYFQYQRLLQKAKQLHHQNSFDIIHCRSYMPVLVGLYMKRKFGCKLLFDMRGFWADERVDGNVWNLNNPLFSNIYSFFKRKEREALLHADYVISLTHNAKSEIEGFPYMKGVQEKIEVIPCCVDTNLFDASIINPDQLQALRGDLGIKDNVFVITYVGSVGTWYLLPEMLRFFAALRTKRPDSIFLFITYSDPEIIYSAASNLGIPKDSFIIRKARRNEVPAMIKLGNASVFFIKPAYSKKASSPTKQAEIMSLGVPIICNDGVGDTSLVVRKYDAGIVLSNFTDTDFDNAANTLLSTQFNSEKIRSGARTGG